MKSDEIRKALEEAKAKREAAAKLIAEAEALERQAQISEPLAQLAM